MSSTKQKFNKADFMFKGLKGETLIKKPGDVNGMDFMIKDLEDCTVYILDHLACIQMDRCTNCKFYIGPIKGSIFVRNSKNCTISVACSQFRCRDLFDSKVYLYCGNEPVIESSASLTFAPYNFKYPGLVKQADAAGLHKEVNKWDLIFDFTKQESGELNYQIMEPKEWKMEEKEVEGVDERPEVAFPYPVRYGGTIPDDADFRGEDTKMQTFDIKTSAKDAQKQVEKKEIEEAIRITDTTKASQERLAQSQ